MNEINKLNSAGPSTTSWGPPLVAGLQLDPVPLATSLWDLQCSIFILHSPQNEEEFFCKLFTL